MSCGRMSDSIGSACTELSLKVFINRSDSICVKLCKIKIDQAIAVIGIKHTKIFVQKTKWTFFSYHVLQKTAIICVSCISWFLVISSQSLLVEYSHFFSTIPSISDRELISAFCNETFICSCKNQCIIISMNTIFLMKKQRVLDFFAAQFFHQQFATCVNSKGLLYH